MGLFIKVIKIYFFSNTGYVRYTNERRDELKKLYPELLVTDITKKLGEEWNSMCIEKKKPYLDAAEIDKKR